MQTNDIQRVMAATLSPPAANQEPLAASLQPHAGHTYDATFAICYVANTLMMVAVSLLFRYADFVHWLGGGEMELGLIVGIGMIGALVMRLFQGVAIDRFGARIIWLSSIALFASSLLAHLLIRVNGPGVYALRILYMIGVSGAFGSSITFVSLRAHESRMAEMIGVLGSSGFIGIAVGPALGDWLMGSGEILRVHIHRMFITSALMSVLSLLLVAIGTAGTPAPRVRRRWPPMLAIVRRYHPGAILLVAVAAGLGTQLPNVFLRPYAKEISIDHIRSFFLVYAGAAFIIRWLTRHWTDRVGPRPVALLGLGCLSVSMLLFLPVHSELSLSIPAMLAGVAHAFIFPAIVSGGGNSFPSRYRGLATTVTLSMFDLGNLLGQPAVGLLVHFGRVLGWKPYDVMFVVVAGLMAGAAVIYYATSSGESRPRRRKKLRAQVAPTEPYGVGVTKPLTPSQ
jgi:MFS family permease